jgi:hypothetical protein
LLDRECRFEEPAEDPDDRVRLVAMNDHLALVDGSVESPVVEAQEPEVLEWNGATRVPGGRHPGSGGRVDPRGRAVEDGAGG